LLNIRGFRINLPNVQHSSKVRIVDTDPIAAEVNISGVSAGPSNERIL